MQHVFLFIQRCIIQTIGLLVVPADPNEVLTFAGGPVVYEHEWNQIPIARREQTYMSAIAGIIHDSSASSIAVFRLEYPWNTQDTCKLKPDDATANISLLFLSRQTQRWDWGTENTCMEKTITVVFCKMMLFHESLVNFDTVNVILLHFAHVLDVYTTLWTQ